VGKKILFNGISAQVGGGITFLVNLLPRLCRRDAGNRYTLLVGTGQPWLAPLQEIPNLEIREIALKGPTALFRPLFERNQIPAMVAEEGFDLLCSIADTTSLGASCPKLLWIRNYLIHTPRDVGWPLSGMPRIWFLRYLSRKSMRGADRIIFVSRGSRDEIGKLNRLPESRSEVIYHGISEAFRATARASATKREKTVLSVSSIYRYKNFVPLVEAFQEWGAKRDQWQLRIIGKNLDPDYFALMEKARRAGPCTDRIHFESEIPYAEIQQVYASAGLFVFPSILETFGHPLLEAMACGLPVVAADMPVSREICGEYATYFDWDDARDCARAMQEAFEARRVVPEDYFEARGFTWDQSADSTLEVIRELLVRA
jgi:glycosyltransferase involved in cell wall biosynthesis